MACEVLSQLRSRVGGYISGDHEEGADHHVDLGAGYIFDQDPRRERPVEGSGVELRVWER